MENKPVVLVVMDGVALTTKDNGNAVMHAYKPNLDKLFNTCPNTTLRAHGKAVGLPCDEDMGNSEVGHNAIGSGQIYSQGSKLVNESIESKEMFESATWKKLVTNVKENNTNFHFIGLLSDGKVHANIAHLIEMLKQLKQEGVKKVLVHAILDGRDVEATSAHKYVAQIEEVFANLNDENFNAKIASGGGRMEITMDRYDADWDMVKRGWEIHVEGKGRQFETALDAINTYREELNCIDQFMPGFVIAKNGNPVGRIEDNDSVVFFNFRGDRAIELSKAFEEENFTKFEKEHNPNVIFAGMLEYDGDNKIPKNYLVNPPKISNTLTNYLVSKNINEYAISETQKFGHVTYFWNGNKSEKISEELETWVEIKSDTLPLEERPWMKSSEITDKLIQAINSNKYQFLRVNYPNGDMVGHTGSFQAAKVSVEAVDIAIGRLIDACKKNNYTLIVTADHGNADEMYEEQKNTEDTPKPKTSHTLNRVPFIIFNGPENLELKEDDKFGLSNIAATVVDLLGFEVPDYWNCSLINKK